MNHLHLISQRMKCDAYLGGAQSCLVQSNSVPTYVFPRHVTLTTSTPPSVSCHTIPSNVTEVKVS